MRNFEHANFNSIKVQFKQNPSATKYVLNSQFQFHKGSIQTLRGNDKVCYIIVFQFHKGSIQTPRRKRIIVKSKIFQFHKGSIQTVAV